MSSQQRAHESSSARQNVSQAGSLSASVARLSSSDHRRVYQALVEIRTIFVKQKDGVARLRQHGGLDRILQVLSTTNHKNLDVALSVLGNCCMESQTRQRVLHKEGIPCIIKVMRAIEVDSIRNRACRTLANLALDKHCCTAIHEEEDALQTIVNCLKETKDEDSQQTYIRALRILADTPGHKARVLDVEGLKAVSELLKSSSVGVLSTALKTVAHFMNDSFSVECLRQLISSDALSSLLSLTKHDNLATQNNAKSLLLASLKQEQLRPPLGNAGAIEFLIETITGEMTPKEKYPYLNSLCLCCQEVVNRVRIKDQGGLQLFLKLLDDHKYHLIHYRIISALVCFLYDTQGFETLVQSNVVKILLKHLRQCSKIGKAKPTLDFETPLDVLDDKHLSDFKTSNVMFEHNPAVGPDGAATSSKIIDANDCECNEEYEHVGELKCELATSSVNIQIENEDLALVSITPSRPGGDTHSFPANFKPQSVVCSADKPETKQLITDAGPDSDADTLCSTTNSAVVSRDDTFKFCDPNSQEVRTVVVDSSTDNESQEADISSSDTDGKLDLSQASTSKTTKYSMDSPTYKEVSEWEMSSSSYRAGPTNIYESASFYSHSACASPDRRLLLASPPRTGPYSPMSVSSYLSSDWSPEGSPLRDNSQNTCQSLSPTYSPGSPSLTPGLSPTPAALSEFDLAWDRQTRAEGQSPAWSSTPSSSNMATGFHSPDSLSRAPSPPLSLGAPWWGDVTLTNQVEFCDEYSSEEETASQPDEINEETSPSQELVEENSCEMSEVCQNVLASDPVYEHAMHSSEFGTVLEGTNLVRSISADSSFTQTSPDTSRRTFQIKRKKTESSPETKLKILKVVEMAGKDKSRTLDIDTLIAKLSSSVSSPEVEEKHDEVNIHKDPMKTTEHNILVLLSRISYLPNPSQHLVSQSVFEDLMDYISKSDKPLARCSRILLRLSKNPHCLEAFVLKLIPLIIHLKWLQKPQTPQNDNSSLVCENSTENVLGSKSPGNSQSSTFSTTSEKKHVIDLGEQFLNNVSLVCETRFGAGVLEHLLLTGTESIKQRCALSLPFLCWTSSLRKRMFLTLNGLNILISCLKTEIYLHLAASSLHNLAKKVNIRSTMKNHVGLQCASCNTQREDKQEDDHCALTFLLDNGSKVKANRSALIAQSGVFAAMLGGHYSEASQSEIRITHATEEGFTVLMAFANGIPLSIQSGNSLTMDILLDVTALADRYNMADLLLQASTVLCQQHLSKGTLCKMLEFALHHNNIYLAKHCLCYLFLEPMSYTERAMLCSKARSTICDWTELENYLKELFTRSFTQ